MYKYVQNRFLTCLKLLLALTDLISLNIIFLLAFSLATDPVKGFQKGDLSEDFYSLFTTLNLVALLSSLIYKTYSDSSIERLENVFRLSFKTVLILILVFTSCLLFNFQIDKIASLLILFGSFILIYTLTSRFLLTYVYTIMPKRFGWSKKVALIGNNEYLSSFAGPFQEEHAFYNVNTIQYKNEGDACSKEDRIAQFKCYFEEVSNLGIYDVFVISSPDISEYSKELILAAENQCLQLNFVSTVSATIPYYSSKNNAISTELPVLRSHDESLSLMDNRLKKRIVDLFISSLVIIFILSWLIPIIGILIKIQSPGPIFFKQLRSGRNNQNFECLKFRSMVVNKDSDNQQAVKGDNRITPIGHFLRKSNLDEFPQFINVFLGQMSVVGPRPHMLAHTEHYSKLIQHYMVRQFVKPGITGWAQVNGFRGETKNPELMAKRVEYDLEYMNNWSAMLDFKIVYMTALNMIRGEKNAY